LADNQTIPALLPLLVKSLHITIEQAGLLAVFYSIAAAAASLVSGTLSDHFGRRRFLIPGAVLFAVSSWLASRIGSFSHLVMARTLTGLAAGTISTCSIAYAGDWFPYRVRGRAIGIISIAYFAAPILGVPLAAQVASHFGWRQTFVFFSGLALAVAGVSLFLPRVQPASFGAEGRFNRTLRACRSFLRRRDTSAGLVIAFLVSGGLYTFIYYIGQWLNVAFHVGTGTIGWVFMLGGLMAAVSAPLGGAASDRFGKKPVSIVSNILLAISVALVPFFGWGIWLLAAFGGASLAAAFRQGPLTALMTELVPAEERGSFIALRNVASQTGIGLTVLAGGALFEHHGYAFVTTLCAAMTAAVAALLAAYIAEPRSGGFGTEGSQRQP
jgi:predicted MFS family arabinose efflux permease